MTIDFDSVSLAGAASDCFDQPRNFRMDHVDEIQMAPILRAAKPNLHHRGNRHYQISWETSRSHADATAAENFLISHAQEFTEVGALVLAGTTSLTLNPAVVKCTGAYTGSVTYHAYQAQGTLAD